MSNPQPVVVSYTTLESNPDSLQSAIAGAFGSDAGCLGVIVISDIPPHFKQLRKELFYLINRFAALPASETEKYASPETSYSFGWSHGKEVMNGRPDTQKGSFYANPILDKPDVSEEKRKAHPEYYAGNIWPNNSTGLDSFESTFKALGRLIYDIGLLLAEACQPFVDNSSSSQSTNIASLISSSQTNKARLLHYFSPPKANHVGADEEALDSLCGTHIDHSLLTGLCSAMYLVNQDSAGQPEETKSPDDKAGLYIYPRAAQGKKATPVKVSIPSDCLAFQIGEALELLTDGKLAATPHFVRGHEVSDGRDISRETFAFFLQPDVDDVISSKGETFGQFTKRVLERHYNQ